jgi:hypothetical protein
LLGKPQGLRVVWDWNVYAATTEMVQLRVLNGDGRWNVKTSW